MIEAAIIVTRLHILPIESIDGDFKKLKVIVEKTAGPDEAEAFRLLESHLQNARLKKLRTDGQPLK